MVGVEELKKHEEDDDKYEKRKSMVLIISTSIACCITGVLVLARWACQYYQTFSQLWMVPFGLILSATPVVIWLSLLASEPGSTKYFDHKVHIDDHPHDLEK